MTLVCRQCGRDFEQRTDEEECRSCTRAADEREQRAAEAYDDPDPIIDERSYP